MLDSLQAVAGSALRWLTLGRDVVVRGDTGSGRSTVLSLVARSGERARLDIVVVDWHDLASRPLPLSASTRVRRGVEEVVDELVGDLGQHGALLVDDIDLLDDSTLEVLDRVLRRSGARVVATAVEDLVRSGRPALSRLVAARAPAEVRIPPLGYQATARLLTERLGGAPEASAVSSVTAWSAGNPAVAVAMVDAMQFAGAVERRGDGWVTTGDLDAVPLDAVAHLLATGLHPGAQDALELLSVLGPASAEIVRRLVPDADLAQLVARNRVVSYGGDRGDLLAVSPPALARAVRARLTEPRRLELASMMVAEVGGRDLPLPTVRTGLTDMILASTTEQHETYWRWAAELTGLVHERAVVDEARVRAAWEEQPTVALALPYLVTLLRRPSTERARDVFDGSARGTDDAPELVALFDILRTYWLTWWRTEAELHAESAGRPPESGSGLIGEPPLRALVEQARTQRWDDDALLRALAEHAADLEEPFRSETVMHAVSILLEAGRPAAVLRLTEHLDVPAWLPSELPQSIAGVRGMALLLSGRVADAEAYARAELERAYDALDVSGIRVHSVTLAHALTVLGQWTAAWRVVSTSLRLGPPGPLGSAFYRRTLTLATMLASLVENSDVAQMMLAELRHTRALHQPVVDAMHGIAEAYALLGEGRDADADDLMWRNGVRCLAEGRPTLALEYWVLRAEPATAAQVEQMRAVVAEAELPLFAPLVDLHAALLEDDLETLVRATRSARMEMVPGLTPRVLTAIEDLRRAAGLAALSEAEVDDLLGDRLAEALRSVPPVHRSADVLSDREREVAVLAAEGLTNRDIAEQLHLSPRTVENHVHRALRKLGVSSRSRLADVAF